MPSSFTCRCSGGCPQPQLLRSCARRGERLYNFHLTTSERIAVPILDILPRVPEITLRFVRVRFSLLFTQGGEAFGFLESSARCFSSLAAGEEGGAND